MVAVGVGNGGIPHVIADEGFLGSEAAGLEFVIKDNRILACEPQGNAFAALFFRDTIGIVFLEHQSGAA